MRTIVAFMAISFALTGPAVAEERPPLCDSVGGAVNRDLLVARETVRLPLVGEVARAEIGRSMISTWKYSVYGGQIELLEAIRFEGPPAAAFKGRKQVQVNPDHRFKITIPAGWYGRADPLSREVPVAGFLAPGITAASADGRNYAPGAVGIELDGPDRVKLVWGYTRAMWMSDSLPARYRQATCANWAPGDFRRELIYGGLSGTTISITYREYLDSPVRPSTTQELRYDLSAGKEVGFGGARFEIIKATNTEITYRVLTALE